MANPFDAFDTPAPAPKANPFDAFDQKTAPPAAQPAAQPDWLLAHLAQGAPSWSAVGQNINQASQDYMRAKIDDLTFGQGDRLQSFLTGNDIAKERALTEQSRGRLGPMDAITSAALYGVGPGQLKIAARGADLARTVTGGAKGAGWLGGILGAGTEGAGTAALGTAGHGGSAADVEKSALLGGTIGAATGVLGVGSAKPMGVAQTVQEAENAKNAAYFPTHSVQYGAVPVDQAINSAQNTLTSGQRTGISSTFQSTIDKHLKDIGAGTGSPIAPTLSDIDNYIRNLKEAASTDADKRLSLAIATNLEDLVKTQRPLTGQAPADAVKMLADAKTAQQQLYNAKMIAEAQRVGKLPGEGGVGETMPAAAGAALKKNPQFFDANETQAMNALAGAGGMIPGGWLIKHAVAYPALGAGIGAISGGVHGYSGSGQGQDPWVRALQESAEGLGAGLVAGAGARSAKNMLVNSALRTAAPTLTSGAAYRPPPSLGADALRYWLFGRGAAGRGY